MPRETLSVKVARLEERIKTVFNKLEEYNDILHEIKSKLDTLEDRLVKIELNTKTRLSGKEKAAIYTALITSVTMVIIKVLEVLV